MEIKLLKLSHISYQLFHHNSIPKERLQPKSLHKNFTIFFYLVFKIN